MTWDARRRRLLESATRTHCRRRLLPDGYRDTARGSWTSRQHVECCVLTRRTMRLLSSKLRRRSGNKAVARSGSVAHSEGDHRSERPRPPDSQVIICDPTVVAGGEGANPTDVTGAGGGPSGPRNTSVALVAGDGRRARSCRPGADRTAVRDCSPRWCRDSRGGPAGGRCRWDASVDQAIWDASVSARSPLPVVRADPLWSDTSWAAVQRRTEVSCCVASRSSSISESSTCRRSQAMRFGPSAPTHSMSLVSRKPTIEMPC